jgi:hypothetical protein
MEWAHRSRYPREGITVTQLKTTAEQEQAQTRIRQLVVRLGENRIGNRDPIRAAMVQELVSLVRAHTLLANAPAPPPAEDKP